MKRRMFLAYSELGRYRTTAHEFSMVARPMRGSRVPTDMAEDSPQPLVTRASLMGGVVGGFVHTGVAVFLWNYFGFDSLVELLTIKPLNAVYLMLGMFLLGFVPVMFYVGQRFISPAVVVGGFLLLSGIGSGIMGPVRAPMGGPTPFGLYILLWVGIVALAALTGRIESHRKHRATG